VRRCAGALLSVLVVAAGTGCGSSDGDHTTSVDPFSVVPTQPTDSEAAARHAAPRYERVAALTGSGSAKRSFTVAAGAIQWRARWRCSSGPLQLTASATTSQRSARATSSCPRTGSMTGVRTGRQTLEIDTPGRWRVDIEQQVDTALHEPPLASMRAGGARVLSRGRFYDIERHGRGSALLYRLPGGRMALRLEHFVTSANIDLHVWISRTSRPRNTVQAQRSRHRDVALLKSTLGDENYVLPSGTRTADVRSVIIWCEPVRIAYTAVTLRSG
jgi:hypothetical protein